MNSRFLLLIVVLVLIGGCGRQDHPSVIAEKGGAKVPALPNEKETDKSPIPSLESLLVDLNSNNEKVRKKAKGDLFRLRHKNKSLTLEQGLKALRAAAQPIPLHKPDPEISEYLVDLAQGNPRPEYIPVVVELFDKFSDRGKEWALLILARLGSRESSLALMGIVRKFAKEGGIPFLPTGLLERKPRHADIFFPELLQYGKVPKISMDVYHLCLAYCEAKVLPPKTLIPYTDQVLEAYRVLAEKLRPAQRNQGIAWMWEEKYSENRFNAGLFLDLLGFFPPDKVENELRQAMDFHDPRLKHFAIVSLLRLGKPVEGKHVADVAGHAEMRNWLYAKLGEFGKLSLFPNNYRTQAAFAESDMVNWLIYPTELGRVPEEIELMKVVPIDTGLEDGIYDYYLFRFRTLKPHWAAKDGWMAGLSGPFRRKEAPTTNSLGDTFSTFTKWDSKKPEEHVGDIRVLMKKWREYHLKKMD